MEKTFEEFISEATDLDYEGFKAARAVVDAEVDSASKELKKFPRGNMGLTPDDVKNSPEFKSTKRAYDVAFKKLQTLNKTYVKRFKKELAADRKARRG
jgi:hypothetical protein